MHIPRNRAGENAPGCDIPYTARGGFCCRGRVCVSNVRGRPRRGQWIAHIRLPPHRRCGGPCLSLWGMALRKQGQGASPQGTNAVCPSGRLRGLFRSCTNSHPPCRRRHGGRADMRAFRPLVRPLRDRSANADRLQNRVMIPHPQKIRAAKTARTKIFHYQQFLIFTTQPVLRGRVTVKPVSEAVILPPL